MADVAKGVLLRVLPTKRKILGEGFSVQADSPERSMQAAVLRSHNGALAWRYSIGPHRYLDNRPVYGQEIVQELVRSDIAGDPTDWLAPLSLDLVSHLRLLISNEIDLGKSKHLIGPINLAIALVTR